MAAYSALVSLLNDLEHILNHPRHSFSFENKQIKPLSQTVHFLIDFLESCDAQGCSGEAAEVLESRIASAAHAAHDVVESHVVDQIHAGSTLVGKPRSYFLFDLEKAIDNMNSVKREVMQCFAEKSGKKSDEFTYSPPTSSEPQTLRKNRMVGFDAVAERLMEMLVGEPSRRLVIPIVGMCGMGKTTLAKNVFEHSLVEYHFDVRHWATISQEYSAKTILTQLVCGDTAVNKLGEKLHKNLWGRRYLIILDDVWSMKAWDEVHMFLPDNDNGSRVIVTTRQSNLANNLSSSPFKMEFLVEDESWKLFCGEAFGEEECPSELEGIGKKIVGKCQGLPLSIVVIGAHLRRSSRAIDCWQKVANLINPISSSEEGDKCMKILCLIYDQLPPCLKPCFLYMGKFLEDERIYVTQLLRFWVAEGFLRAKEGVSWEEVAEDYLNDLVDRNLVIVHQRMWNGKPEICGVHDVVRELCIKVSERERFVCVFNKLEDISMARRIVIPVREKFDISNALKSTPLLRSLTIKQGYYTTNNIRSRLPLDSMKLLRVSDGGCPLAADFQPVNLRYLDWDSIGEGDNIHDLLGSIFLFWNLQTLIVSGNYGRITAPQEIWVMVQLRHLVFEISQLHLPSPPPNDQQDHIVLRNLQTLVGVNDFIVTEEVCERMPNIKDLSVIYLCSGHYPCNLGRLSKLESLKLRLYGNYSVQSFTFPSSLKELDLRTFYGQRWEDVGVAIGNLPHLLTLRLEYIKGTEWSLVEEEFTCLKCFTISSCFDLTFWDACSSHFPALRRLQISDLQKTE